MLLSDKSKTARNTTGPMKWIIWPALSQAHPNLILFIYDI